MKNFLKPFGIIVTNYRRGVIAAMFVMAAVIALIMPAGDLSAQSAPSLDGVWQTDRGHAVTINGPAAVSMQLPSSALWRDAINKGYVKVGDQKLRNLTRTGDLSWTGEDLDLTFDTFAPDVATGVIWRNCTIAMSEDGQTLIIFTFGKDFPTVIYSRK